MRGEAAVGRKERRALAARLKEMAERSAAGSPRGKLTRGRRAAVRSVQAGAIRADAAADRGIDRVLTPKVRAAGERALDKLPPKVREQVRETIQGGHELTNPSGKLFEFPSWLNPF